MSTVNVTKDDMIFFMDMVGSGISPNLKPKLYSVKPYYKILDDPYSDEFHRFIKIYHKTKHILKKRDRQISDDIYGIYKPRTTLKVAGKPHHIGPESVRQILRKAEFSIVKKLMKSVNGAIVE